MQFDLTAEWTSGIAFRTNIQGFDVEMDSGASETSVGPSPKRMMLASLLACTGMDVVSLLQKMRVPFRSFRVEGSAPITDEHPKVFREVNLRYIITGKNIKRDKVEKAIDLSQTKYCGVSIMVKSHCPVNWELEIVESEVAEEVM